MDIFLLSSFFSLFRCNLRFLTCVQNRGEGASCQDKHGASWLYAPESWCFLPTLENKKIYRVDV